MYNLYESGVAINHSVISICFFAGIGFLPDKLVVVVREGPIAPKKYSNVRGNILK